MKTLAPVLLLTLALGIGAGVVFERDRRALREELSRPAPEVAAVTPAGAGPATDASKPESDPRVESLEGEIRSLKARIAALEAGGAAARASVARAGPVEAPEVVSAKIEELRARLQPLLDKKDGVGLVFLLRHLAALGEPGFPLAVEIAQMLYADSELETPQFGDYDFDVSEEAFDPLLTWALTHPAQSFPWLRSQAVDTLSDRNNLDAAALFLAALRNETDTEVAVELAREISNLARPAMTAEISDAAVRLGANREAREILMEALVDLDTPESRKAVETMSGAEDPVLQETARLELLVAELVARPTATGVLLTHVPTGSGWEAAGARAGDILLDCDGSPFQDFADFQSRATNAAEGATLTFRARRAGDVVTLSVRDAASNYSARWVSP